MPLRALTLALVFALSAVACQPKTASDTAAAASTQAAADASSDIAARVAAYEEFELKADISHLAEGDREAIGYLLQAGQIMDDLFWKQVVEDKDALLEGISDPATRRFVEINYGPWDRLDGDAPFVEGVGPRSPGAGFYPADMTKAEFEAADLPGKDSQYTLVRRDDAGELVVVPYHEAYASGLGRAADLLRQAATVATDAGLRNYLRLRADALLSGDYRASDMAWMDMKTSPIDVVIGPIESYQDALYGTKAAFEAFVLVKDVEWSERLAKFAQFLPALQRELPVAARYKAETPGSDADLNAYDAIYYGGDANAGAKTIAINLPNDEQVQLAKGSRRLQLKNAMRAKFDAILEPIADELIVPDQREHITFDAFFENVMFHEVAHGLGIKNTLDGKGTVREALTDLASGFEEGKADILGLYMIGQLGAMGELDAARLDDNYVTFLAGIFRSVRFGATSAHGQANMAAFNFLQEQGAFSRDPDSGHYRVDFAAMKPAVDALSAKILTLQGDGDYAGARAFLDQYGKIGPQLQSDLDRIARKNIPVDIVFKQGREVLGM
ncbi:dipeptidyl-peptidase 3 family protein [Novilysobacter avium]|uniref:Zn-dependent hydrolase n=1 Tax=Novilysobacter avium TaxID=2781023 RepID=A0A7S6ZVG5_9GAMM|nr:Zn-dependent hydrolase [Lysobacter avium]QOW23015.1 Zn-dependent hydrolase [Lysobacter avium]